MARDSDFAKHQKLKAAANLYLRKPISETQIFNKVVSLLGFLDTYSGPDRILEDSEYGNMVYLHRTVEGDPSPKESQAPVAEAAVAAQSAEDGMAEARARIAEAELPNMSERVGHLEHRLKEALLRVRELEETVRRRDARIAELEGRSTESSAE